MAVEVGHEGPGLDFIPPEMIKAPAPGGQKVPTSTAAALGIRRNDADAGFCQIVPVAYPFGIPLANQKDDGRRVRCRVIGQLLFPTGIDEAGPFQALDIVGQGQSHDVSPTAFDDRPGLAARTAVRLDDADILSGLRLIMLLKGFIIFFI